MMRGDNRRSRRFTTRPFWRDWVLGGVLLGIGFAVTPSFHDPRTGLPSIVLMAAGAIILLAALTHAVGVSCGLWERDDIR